VELFLCIIGLPQQDYTKGESHYESGTLYHKKEEICNYMNVKKLKGVLKRGTV